MSSRNVAVQQTVYQALVREKRPAESFTSLFRRLLDQKEGLEELAGSWGQGTERADRVALRTLRSGGRRTE